MSFRQPTHKKNNLVVKNDVALASKFTPNVNTYRHVVMQNINEQLKSNIKHLQSQLANIDNKTQNINQETAKKWEDINKLIHDKMSKVNNH